MDCPNCNIDMKPIKAETGLGIGITLDSFYCQRCDTSVTDRESIEEMIDKIKPGHRLVVNSRFRLQGAAA